MPASARIVEGLETLCIVQSTLGERDLMVVGLKGDPNAIVDAGEDYIQSRSALGIHTRGGKTFMEATPATRPTEQQAASLLCWSGRELAVASHACAWFIDPEGEGNSTECYRSLGAFGFSKEARD